MDHHLVDPVVDRLSEAERLADAYTRRSRVLDSRRVGPGALLVAQGEQEEPAKRDVLMETLPD